MAQATAPTECPFGSGRPFTVVIPEDIASSHGNVSVPAGTYQAWQSALGQEGEISLWSPEHYAGPMWTGLAPWHWHFPGEAPRSLPEHDCFDKARSGVAGGIYCGICMADLG